MVPGAAIAAASTLVVSLPSVSGLFGLVGLLIAAGTALAGGLAVWSALPQLMIVAVPALLPIPLAGLVFPWELALGAFTVAIALHGFRQRAAWLWRLSDAERWLLLFTGWGLFTIFWSTTPLYYLLGVRRLFTGVCALWVATRLPHVASRRWFDLGIVCAASSIALAAIVKSLTSGFSATQMLLHRSQVTDLGWGTANYVATLLLLCGPFLLRLVLRGRPLERVLGGIAFALVTVVQFVVASRAATLLFALASIIQLVHATRRFRLGVGLAGAGTVAALVASPLGVGLLSRLGSLRELGSMTIRIWYFREGWRRLLEHLPWGMGLGQGYANADKLHGIDPHDYWLLLGGDLGIPGLVLWAGVLVAMVRGWLAVRVDEPGRDLAFTILLTFAIANLHTLVEPTFQGVQYQLIFMWVVCGTLAYAQAERGRAVPEVPVRVALPGPPDRGIAAALQA
jgi:hypothetical protein